MHNYDDIANSRRRFLGGMGALGVAAFSAPLAAEASKVLTLPFENGARTLTSDFPQKTGMILLRTRPPLLETPFDVFDQGVLTPCDRFFVRWHLANIPTSIDPASYRLVIRGNVDTPLSLNLHELITNFKRTEIVAVNQCAGNSRGMYDPRVPGAQWAHGAMGNARWMGVRLKDLLERAGVRGKSIQVRFKGLDTGVIPATPQLMKSIDIDHALDGEVMVAYAMNGQALPFLNGYPIRLIVPGWFATYWIKMLSDIEVLDKPDDNFWTTKAYLRPDTPNASVQPGQKGFNMVPVSFMVPRSFFTNIRDSMTIRPGQSVPVRGIAFGGKHGLAKVLFSSDHGQTWSEPRLGQDYGKYSFRQWETSIRFEQPGSRTLMVRAVDTTGRTQDVTPTWNGSGFMRNVVETVDVHVV